MRALEGYSWPGNVRELRQVVERAFILAEKQATLQPEHLMWGTGELSSEINLMPLA
jgi:transcriptional regulator with PAS, ATPase and Fis domain